MARETNGYSCARGCSHPNSLPAETPSGFEPNTEGHRLHFRQREKERLLSANRFTIACLAFLAAAMIGAVVLITDFLYGPAATIGFGLAAGAVFVWLWAALPLLRRLQ